uniref:3-dehydrosphinganine reductase n=1 Tax=Palpitomonas bilix TaxID=652834 RepID=A0A7S3LU35_9EUKA|mmetsp:Transcript_46158/g.118943  ORF Transcript_46158/g.118943 Transcript_46158/m.118943 type:complete len:358 (+) Transcript_46158:108-1181(+)
MEAYAIALIAVGSFLTLLILIGVGCCARRRHARIRLDGRHVLITGGSSGLGLAIAKEAARRGAYVTILARTTSTLAEATASIQQVAARPDAVQWVSADVTKLSEVEEKVKAACTAFGRPFLVLCCAGAAEPSYFLQCDPDLHRAQMDLNFHSCVNTARACIPLMSAPASANGGKERGESYRDTSPLLTRPKYGENGHIVFTSSLAGMTGVFGYTAYSAAKWAVRGFAESLYYELLPLGVGVSVMFPGDVDTPGYARENERKPEETKAMEGQVKCISAEKAAKKLLAGVLDRRFLVTYGDGFLLECSVFGLSPRGRALHFFLSPIVHLAKLVVVPGFEKVARRSRYFVHADGVSEGQV